MSELLRSLSRDPLYLNVGPHRLEIPYLPASYWAAVVSTRGPSVALLRAAGSEALLDALVEDEELNSVLTAASQDLLATLGDRKWWEVVKLVQMSGRHEALGRLTLAGVDPDRVTLGQWVSATLALFLQNADEKVRNQFLTDLSLPPEGFEEEWDDGNDFMEMAAFARSLPGMS